MELFLALVMDIVIATGFTAFLALLAFGFKSHIRTALQDFLGIEKVRKIHGISNKQND